MKVSKMKKIVSVGLASALLPIFAFAQNLQNVEGLTASIGRIINLAIPIVFALAMLFFFWGLAQYILGGEDTKVSAKKTMIWGVVALFVMASVWGLVRFIGSAVGVSSGTGPGFNAGDLVPR